MITAIFNLPENKTLEVQLSRTTPIPMVKSMLQDKTGISASSIKLEIGGKENATVLSDDAELSAYERHIQNSIILINVSSSGSGFTFKQMYCIGYGMPALIFALFFTLYPHKSSLYYCLITFCVALHFLKRISEGFFVHVLNNEKVPFSWGFGMIFYYGFLFGVLVSVEVFYLRPNIQMWSDGVWITLLGIFLLSEFFNFYCHYQLGNLRVEKVNGVTRQVSGRKVPVGLFFDSVISPNYSFELLIWLSFALLFKTYAGFAFFVFSFIVLVPRTKENKEKMVKIASQISPEVKTTVQKRYLLFPYII